MVNRLLRLLLVVAFATTPLLLSAQSTKKVEEQRQKVEQYRKDLERAKSEVSKLKKEKSSASERVKALNRQMNLRNNYIAETEREKDLVKEDIAMVDHLADSLQQALDRNRTIYGEAVRAAYRSYRQNTATNYLFSSEGISDASRRMAQVQHLADSRKALAEEIARQEEELGIERERLATRRHELDSITMSLEKERASLAEDKKEAQRTYNNLSSAERKALNNQQQQQKRLNSAIAELRKLTEGNTAGSSFSDKTKALNLPVVGGSVSKAQGNMATITGKRGSDVRSIYEGKVIRISKDNTNHSMVFIAHGQYISVYTHLGSVSVKENQTVKRDQKIGTIGIGIDHTGKESAYMQFMINHADSNKRMSVMDCFKK
jgi:septal ring factor EnvC (AmiA/AmiB activator)